ncbi:MAG: hypothetical protein WCD82_20065, partial [Xanthobacteraceae bacterium]
GSSMLSNAWRYDPFRAVGSVSVEIILFHCGRKQDRAVRLRRCANGEIGPAEYLRVAHTGSDAGLKFLSVREFGAKAERQHGNHADGAAETRLAMIEPAAAERTPTPITGKALAPRPAATPHKVVAKIITGRVH